MNGGTSRVYHCAPALAVQAPVASKSCHNAHQRRESMQPLIPGAYPSLFFVSVSLIFLVIPVDPSHPLPFPGYIIGIAPVLRYEAGLDFDSPPVEPTSIATARRMSTMSAHSELSVSTTASPRLRHVGCHLNCWQMPLALFFPFWCHHFVSIIVISKECQPQCAHFFLPPPQSFSLSLVLIGIFTQHARPPSQKELVLIDSDSRYPFSFELRLFRFPINAFNSNSSSSPRNFRPRLQLYP